MKDGLIQQVDEPLNVYDNPKNLFVAGFIGTPPMNSFKGRIQKVDGKLFFKDDSIEIPLPEEWKEIAEPLIDKEVVFGIRPEDLGSEEAEKSKDAPKIKAKIEVVEPMGSETYLYLAIGTHSFISRVDAHRKTAVGDEIELSITMKKAHLFDGETEQCVY